MISLIMAAVRYGPKGLLRQIGYWLFHVLIFSPDGSKFKTVQ